MCGIYRPGPVISTFMLEKDLSLEGVGDDLIFIEGLVLCIAMMCLAWGPLPT